MLQGCPLSGLSLVWVVCSHIIVEPWLLLECQWVELTFRLTGCEEWLRLQLMGCFVGSWPQGANSFKQGSGACRVYLLGVPFLELTGWCSAVVWSWLPGVLVLGLLGRDSGAGPDQETQGPLVGSTKWSAVCSCQCWALRQLGKTVLPWVLGLGPLNERYRVYWGQCCLFRVCGHLRDFRQVYSRVRSWPLVRNHHWNRLGPLHELGGL